MGRGGDQKVLHASQRENRSIFPPSLVLFFPKPHLGRLGTPWRTSTAPVSHIHWEAQAKTQLEHTQTINAQMLTSFSLL